LEPDPDRGRHYESFVFHFDTFSEMDGDFKRVDGKYYRSLKASERKKGPLLIMAPILAGAADDYLACKIFSRWAAANGMSSFYVYQEEDILIPKRDGVELERLFRENVQDNIKTLDLLLERPEVDPKRLGTFGISMGAIKNVILMAVEPRLEGNVLCMAGADLGQIVLSSKEKRVVEYVRERCRREGITPEEIASDIRCQLKAEPGRWAETVSNERVLLFLGIFDNKVPYSSGLLLREKLGNPETYILPLGHYTSMISATFAAHHAFTFLKRRFGLEEEGTF
jgi:hypothetical protein